MHLVETYSQQIRVVGVWWEGWGQGVGKVRCKTETPTTSIIRFIVREERRTCLLCFLMRRRKPARLLLRALLTATRRADLLYARGETRCARRRYRYADALCARRKERCG
jgi:hypothetical protein